ncbi:hypothetical protein GDO81_011696 [Engystomops pustulosus]|uniref:UBZ4-type domain-containing protein n=1 Tax=Engystomops pustulosus TaxID=76066 RepID=A0AAV7BGB2_ENGPU|nr:hypothetical protein GDO81_011696 [Engystomops pustulosus]
MAHVAGESGASQQGSAAGSLTCPVCALEVPALEINTHLDTCLEKPSGVAAKKRRLSPEEEEGTSDCSHSPGKPLVFGGPNFPMFHKPAVSERVPQQTPSKAPFFSKRTEAKQEVNAISTCETPNPSGNKQKDVNLVEKLNGKPLADKMRPCTLEDYMGQNKVLGEDTMLRKLLQANDIPSFILWGPPGCGKTTLAHIVAKNANKSNTRFVTLSATSASTNDVREVIKQAQNELKLFKRKTILFVDEIHRFNKTQQDTFLPHVECGSITLIGATTENPSFQVNTALLSRCRVIVLEKLSVEAMEAILRRAVQSLGIQVLLENEEAECSSSDTSECQMYIEAKALTTLAHLCDGDARTGLNGLQLSVQSMLAAGPHSQTKGMLINEEHIKEGLQRSHILYDRAGEEHYNCISALHKSMRGSDENASLYWLGRMLEGGEDPLYVARRLVRFASEDIGLADPLALPQAVSTYQACHFIGMPECDVRRFPFAYQELSPLSVAASVSHVK